MARASFRVISMVGVSVRDSAFSQYASGMATTQNPMSAGSNGVGKWSDVCVGRMTDGALDIGVDGCQPVSYTHLTLPTILLV